MSLSFQRVFYVIASIIGLFAILILAKTVIIPIAFAFLMAFILFPVVRKFETWGANKILSALFSILGLFSIVGLAIFLFSSQIIQLSENLIDFRIKVLNVFAETTIFINKHVGILPKLEKGQLMNKLKTWLNESGGLLLSQTFSSTANFVFDFLMSIIYTFLILIYKNGLVRAMVHFYPQEHRKKALNMFKSVQLVGQQYLFGLLGIILILGFVNSVGLWIIGIDNPFLFGFLAAVLAIIPYAGTLLGSAIPILYALISYDSFWMSFTIAIFFWGVQMVDNNFLTPKIVGGKLKINAFTSIVSIIIGAWIWGIAGMILFLPFAAMLNVVCQEYEELKPVALLIGEDNYRTKEVSEIPIVKRVKKLKSWFSKFRSNFTGK